MKLLASGIAATGAVWAALYTQPEPLSPGLVDKAIVSEISIVFWFGAVVMLASRRSWTIRAVGLFLTSVGIAALFGLSAHTLWFSRPSDGVREAFIDLGRATLAIGGLLLFVGLSEYSYRRWGAVVTRDALHPGDPGFLDRRNPDAPGRRADDLAAYKFYRQTHGGAK